MLFCKPLLPWCSSCTNHEPSTCAQLCSDAWANRVCIQALGELTEDQALGVLQARRPSLHQVLECMPPLEAQNRLVLLACMPSIEAAGAFDLPLSDPATTARALGTLASFPNISSLACRPWVPDDAAHQFYELLPSLPNLTALDLSDSLHLSHAACTSLADALRSMPHLKSLRLKHCGLNPQTTSNLFPALSALQSLEEVDLGGKVYDEKSARLLIKSFRYMSNLTRLGLKDAGLDRPTTNLLPEGILALPKMKELDLHGSPTQQFLDRCDEACRKALKLGHAIADVCMSSLKPCTHAFSSKLLLSIPPFSVTRPVLGAIDVLQEGDTAAPFVKHFGLHVNTIQAGDMSPHLPNELPVTAPVTHVTSFFFDVCTMDTSQAPAFARLLPALPNLEFIKIRARSSTPYQSLVPLFVPLASLTRLTSLVWEHEKRDCSFLYARRFAQILPKLTSLQCIHVNTEGYFPVPPVPQTGSYAQLEALGGAFSHLVQLTSLFITCCTIPVLSSLAPVLHATQDARTPSTGTCTIAAACACPWPACLGRPCHCAHGPPYT
jgi:hypothetical protein